MAATPPSLEAEADRLLAETPVLSMKIAAALHAAPATARPGLIEVLRFLDLVADSPTSLSPPHRLDLVWHEFILCTRAYQLYCERRFGRFIHHVPGEPSSPNRGGYRAALERYQRVFGDPDPAWWGRDASLLAAARCGACEARSAGPSARDHEGP